MNETVNTSKNNLPVSCNAAFVLDRDNAVDYFTSTNRLLCLFDLDIEKLNDFCFSSHFNIVSWWQHRLEAFNYIVNQLIND